MRLVHAVVAGMAAGLLLHTMFSPASAQAAFFAFPAGWVVFTVLFYRKADTVRKIWARAFLVAAVECFSISLASLVLPLFSGRQTAQTLSRDAPGPVFGLPLGSGLLDVLSGYVGILIGFLLLTIAYFSLMPARRRR